MNILTPPPEWTADALCAQVDPEVWFPEKGAKNTDAKRICGRCEVRAQCLEWALANREPYGVYGGLSARERRNLEREAA